MQKNSIGRRIAVTAHNETADEEKGCLPFDCHIFREKKSERRTQERSVIMFISGH
jgi:hypothetical protein